jgi:hypothetical protein
MVKKVLIGGIFLVGGYFIIKKLLPSNTSSKYDLDLQEYDIKEFSEPKRVNKLNKPINKIISNRPPMRQYGQGFGAYQEIGSESPMALYYS